jgi:hypothetical protein
MLYTRLGKTPYEISRLGFGAMRFPKDNGSYNIDASIEIIRHSIDLGINIVDTAPLYCEKESEKIVGMALQDGYREKVRLSTKNMIRSNNEKWREVLETSLKNLNTDYIDFYYFWSARYKNYTDGIKGEGDLYKEALKAKEEGLIKSIVISSHDTPNNINNLISTGEFDAILLQYNLMNNSNRKCIRLARELGVGVFVMGPAAGGRLEEESPITKLLQEMLGMSIWEMAFRYVFAEEGVDCALSGMSSRQMVEENIDYIAKGGLSKNEVKLIDEVISNKIKAKAFNCTSCGYCMPCPEDVPISSILGYLLMYKAWDMEETAKKWYDGMKKMQDVQSFAEQCTECRECLPKCPSELDIPELIKEAEKLLSD